LVINIVLFKLINTYELGVYKMADAFRNKRYYRVRLADSSLTTFDDTDDAIDKISFTSEWDTNSPDRTYALEDSDTTLVMTVEHSSASNQSDWKDAIDDIWSDSTSPWTGDDSTQTVEHFKTEWLNQDGSVSSTALF
tara:strand:- start:100 stop:510 length:411 start_codon:yes stop_codon:yes gene_type:complete